MLAAGGGGREASSLTSDRLAVQRRRRRRGGGGGRRRRSALGLRRRMKKETMEGHVPLPLPLLPDGETAVGYSKDDASSPLQEEISSLRSRQRRVDRRRREALDRLVELKGSVRVFCRVRPLAHTNSLHAQSSPVTVEQERITVKAAGIKREFGADRVFGQESTQEDVFEEVKPILRSALDGHNVCILAYGQTGTGKTYTMEGTGGNKLGVVPRAIQELFSRASEDGSCAYSFSMSMLEVYLGSLRDLLAAPRQPLFRRTECKAAACSSSLSILATKGGAVEVEGLTDVSTPDLKNASQWYRRGRRARSTAWTNVNDASSRSHCLTRITIRRRMRHGGGGGVSKLWLVDLGGSERLLKTGASGLTMDEGKAINLSLSALGDVIAALRRKRPHVPYRNSKLTQILSDSLGDGSKVVMVVHVSLSEDDVGETVCSLNLAKRARSIEPNREIPQDLKTLKQKRVAELDREIRAAEEELKRLDEQIRRAEEKEISLEEEEEEEEEKKLFASSVCQALSDDEKGSPRSTLVVVGHTDAAESPRATTEKAKGRRPPPARGHGGSAAPHFMSSTVCSRQRRCAGGYHSVGNGKPRLTAVSVNRYPPPAAELSGSQNAAARASRSASVALSSGVHKLRCLRVNKSDQVNVISNSSVDSTAASAPPPRRRESCFGSRPVLQRAAAPLHLHRRRMSSLT
ncbi:kinesin-like protein KIN-14O isoform X6 [Zea mays]|uniref:p-loop containing nucleoside triphosphate hydrolase superfamily protein n=3 Tax=Zea mays TaxID=4577 RepID=A0A1D6PPD9_MAIZE|nr:kinesin-like protein KIN-14O isoform X6 [Zea mays]AQK48701.1 P-loop containing nucleoside triphosphate hydrolase superfamily protein [Zea mays]|eukprot:XP_020408013.1 kinesin-like protein KIN-14O isoform X6 [Zea mays]